MIKAIVGYITDLFLEMRVKMHRN